MIFKVVGLLFFLHFSQDYLGYNLVSVVCTLAHMTQVNAVDQNIGWKELINITKDSDFHKSTFSQ